MNQHKLEQELAGLPLGRIEYFETISSTNDLAAEWAASDYGDLSLIVANEQTRGRGRAGRKWITPPDSALAFSLLLRHNSANDAFSDLNNVSLYTGLGAVAVCIAIESLFRLRPEIKWPNDILLDGKKVCGVLAESHWLGNQLSAIVLGIGINIAPASVPDAHSLNYPATCLEHVVEKQVDREELIKEIIKAIMNLRTSQTAESFLSEWEQRLAFKNRLVLIKQNGKADKKATILGLDSQGRIRMLTQDSEKSIVHFEEIQIHPLVDSSAF